MHDLVLVVNGLALGLILAPWFWLGVDAGWRRLRGRKGRQNG